MIETITAIAIAVFSSIIYALTGFFKKYPPEQFDEEKLFVTLFIAAIVGIVSYRLGVTYDAATQVLVSAGIIVYIESIGKAIYRRIKAKYFPNGLRAFFGGE